MEKQQASSKSFYLWIMLALAVWGGLLAVGSFLGPEYWAPQSVSGTDDAGEPIKTLAPSFDARKPLIVLGCVGVFVGGWALALRGRQKRLERAAREAKEQVPAQDAAVAHVRHER